MNELEIKIKYFSGDVPKIQKIPQGDWIDLYTAEDTHLEPMKLKYIPLGIGMQLPEGYEAIVAPRSSTYKNFGVIMINGIGIIDNSYCGDNDQWHFPALALDGERFIPKGSRVCQFRIQECQPSIYFEEVEHLSTTSRGGLGSTGR